MKNLLVIILTLTAVAHGKPTRSINPYMQDTGLLYLESVESLTLDCGHKSIADSDCLSAWRTRMDGLEDRIYVHMPKTQANTQYFDMLKTARWMRESWATVDKEQERDWSRKYIKCYAYLHTVAKEGELFDSEGACEQ
jgi:hypothetical protein